MKTGRPKVPPLIARSIAVLVVLAVPLFLISASVAWAVNDPGLYRRGFEKYNISVYSGITNDDLQRVGAELRQYFNSSAEPLRVVAPAYGEERELFNEREVHHMRDVKGLVRGVYWVGAIAFLFMVGVKVGGYYLCRWQFAWPMAHWGLYGGLLTLGIVAVVGLFALVGFDSLFLLFHRISFTNDLWQLDPRTDYLLIMFPQGFWFDATIRVAATTVLGAAALAAVSGGYIFYVKRRIRLSEEAD